MFDDTLPQTKIPVRFVNGDWEFLYGGNVPVAEGTFGELTLAKARITDPAFLARISKKKVVKVLEEDTRLMVAVTVHMPGGLPQALRQHLERPKDWRVVFHADTTLSNDTHFVAITIGPAVAKRANQAPASEGQAMLPGLDAGGLWLHFKGVNAEKIVSSSVVLPKEVSATPAQSLNHAFTILSEHYETGRLSHTGSVYQRVFYQEKDGHWYPLGNLRDSELANAEHGLIQDAWRHVTEQLGLNFDRTPEA